MEDPPPGNHGGVVYLVQFTDSNRIDLGLFSLADFKQLREDSLTVVLLDKDELFQFPLPGDRDCLPKPVSRRLLGNEALFPSG